jgi:anti-sigma B factor antagonist/stage II sporulation protein AA (anti-sigma F factor antagonist)
VDFSSSRFADVLVATPVGRVDHTNAERLQAALAPLLGQTESDAHALVLDFGQVEYISSVGLRVLMMASKQARACQARIAVAALQPVVGEIFAISRFNHVLDVFPSVREALAQISPSALAAFEAAQKPESA